MFARFLAGPDDALAAPRSARWPALRRAHLKAEPRCAAGGGLLCRRLEVHHVVPVHVDPTRELDPTNLITLCRRLTGGHHLELGHLGDWRNDGNPNVRQDAADRRAGRTTDPSPTRKKRRTTRKDAG